MRSQRVGHDLAIEQQTTMHTERKNLLKAHGGVCHLASGAVAEQPVVLNMLFPD